MRLLLSLVLVLVLVIGVSFYKNKEYFTSFSTKPMIGNTVTCTKDVPNGKGPGALYQYTSDTVLDWYPDVDSALVFDRNSRTPKNIADCSTFTLGKRLGPAPTTPDTRIGGASGINKSYGGMNTPDAQLGTPGAVVYNPRTKRQESANNTNCSFLFVVYFCNGYVGSNPTLTTNVIRLTAKNKINEEYYR